ncbi:hypothetical protein [Nannocystis pusilla]|uniref:hypothetical protein n=1 Tax=Nannocystis pusilla TaxID=889268 RepID=UPI003B818990
MFESAWPSLDTLLNDKVQALLSDELAHASVVQSVLRSNWQAMQMCLANKATVVGDYLTQQLNKSVFLKKGAFGFELVGGALSKINWAGVRDDPQQVYDAMAQVLVPTALNAITGVPLTGTLVKLYFAAGEKLKAMYNARINKQVVLLPWAEFSDRTDEFITRDVVIKKYSTLVDQTGLFSPPWDPKAGWKFGVAGSKDNPSGYVWAPWTGVEIPWREDAVGAIPGTMRIFGQIQLTPPGAHPPGLDRWVRAAPGFTPRERKLKWPSTKTNTGDFFPRPPRPPVRFGRSSVATTVRTCTKSTCRPCSTSGGPRSRT